MRVSPSRMGRLPTRWSGYLLATIAPARGIPVEWLRDRRAHLKELAQGADTVAAPLGAEPLPMPTGWLLRDSVLPEGEGQALLDRLSGEYAARAVVAWDQDTRDISDRWADVQAIEAVLRKRLAQEIPLDTRTNAQRYARAQARQQEPSGRRGRKA